MASSETKDGDITPVLEWMKTSQGYLSDRISWGDNGFADDFQMGAWTGMQVQLRVLARELSEAGYFVPRELLEV